MKHVLQQKQQLTTLMTVELRQAIELLQYSTFELEQYIRQQELENPLIELKEKEPENSYEDKLNYRSHTAGGSEEMLEVQITNIDMRGELLETVKFMYSDEPTQLLLKYLINNLDDNGYLRLHDNVIKYHSKFNEDDIERGIRLLQHIGPVGIGARSLKECLLLQINFLTPTNRLAESLVAEHLELIADRKWKVIASRMKITMAEVKELYEFIQTLNPWPCSFISDSSIEYWVPDIIVEWKDKELIFHLNDGVLPTIQLNSQYSQLLHSKDKKSSYINEQYKSYQWLLSSIEQRRNTIVKIMKVLLERQKSFLKNETSSLKPLTLKEVAEEINMHESTVSRATTNKVIQTPFGSFDLRTLFTSKLETIDGNCISQANVKALLQSYIADENKFKPHSDQKIAEYFNSEKGITISRRTISKYREELRIPPSSKRKEITV
jgi:RNA polymerase sigma-54 factor